MEMIKVKHTVFSLPFAMLGAMTTAQGIPSVEKLIWISTAVTTARTAAMIFNRLVDQNIDGKNPRTKNRALPTGQVSRRWAICFFIVSVILFGYAANKLGALPRKLAIPAMIVILGYSFCKRFTLLSHIILGLSLAIVPLGASIAVNGNIDPPIWFLAIGILTWTAGFDIIYALQDVSFDREHKLHSIPAHIGAAKSLWISRGMHAVASTSWAIFNYELGSILVPWISWLIVTIILAREQWIVRNGGLERINHAFFTLNSMVGVCLFIGHTIEWALVKL